MNPKDLRWYFFNYNWPQFEFIYKRKALGVDFSVSNKRLNLLKARKKKGLTQQELAKKLGISRVTYIQIESGENDPKISIAKDISKFLEETIEYLFDSEVKANGSDRTFSFMQDYFNRKVQANQIRATVWNACWIN